MRTARGGTRRAVFLAGVRPRVGFRALRDRVLEPLRPLPAELLRDREVDVLLLREPGGEDVRVAMVSNLGHSHTSHTHHTCVSPLGAPRQIPAP